LWAIPGPQSGRWKYALAGWSIAGNTTFQSGTPFTVGNGSDRNNDGILGGRPDIGNPSAPLNTRATIFSKCATGYQNPDTGSCVRPSDVHWVEGDGFPNPATVGRNTLHTGGTNNFDLNLIPDRGPRTVVLRSEAGVAREPVIHLSALEGQRRRRGSGCFPPGRFWWRRGWHGSHDETAGRWRRCCSLPECCFRHWDS
jgi:hypothetical protein